MTLAKQAYWLRKRIADSEVRVAQGLYPAHGVRMLRRRLARVEALLAASAKP